MIRVEQVIDLSWNTSSSYPVVLSILSSITAVDYLVRRQSLKIHNNCAFCDKSTKLAIHVSKCVTKRFGYWATP